MSMFIVIAGLITVLWAQSISYHSAFCTSFLENNSSESMKPKYVKVNKFCYSFSSYFVLRWSKTSTTTQRWKHRYVELRSSLRIIGKICMESTEKWYRASYLWLQKIHHQFLVEPHIESARQRVESRRRIVDHLNKLLTELKPKVTAEEYDKASLFFFGISHIIRFNFMINNSFLDWKTTVGHRCCGETWRCELPSPLEVECVEHGQKLF